MGPKNTNGQMNKSKSSHERYEKTWKYDGNVKEKTASTHEQILQEAAKAQHDDNQPGISTVQNAKISKGNKHIAVRYHFIKDYVKEKELKIEYVPTKENVADIMTKALTKKTFEYLRSKLL